MPLSLPDVTIVAIDTAAPDLTREALRDTLKQIDPGDVLVWSNTPIGLGINTISCDAFGRDDVFRFRWHEVPFYVRTSHFLCIEWDSWVLDANRWNSDWLRCDYIGAPWQFADQHNVGNGGFSLRSTKMTRYVAENSERFPYTPGEDHVLCRWYRPQLEDHGFAWASQEEAQRFAFEWTGRGGPSFGFHGMFNWPLILDEEELEHRIELANDYVRSTIGWREVRRAVALDSPAVQQLTDDPDLHLLVAGQRIEPRSTNRRVYTFGLTTSPAAPVVITSRSEIPARVGINHDNRRLGVAIKGIELRRPGAAIGLRHDMPPLAHAPGGYPPESRFVWTDGAIALPPSLFAHFDAPFDLIVDIEPNGMLYDISTATPARDDPVQTQPDQTIYDRAFFDRHRAVSSASAQIVVPLVLSLLEVRSVVDFGCGVGTWLQAFRQNGVDDILGLDGAYVKPDMLEIPPQYFRATDLENLQPLERGFDLACSLEVAEHLPEHAARAFVRALVNSAPIILFGAAAPGQGGEAHINEQWQDYWVSLFEAEGYRPVDAIRPRIWGNEHVAWWYQQNTLLYFKEGRIPEKLATIARPPTFNLTHPQLHSR